MDLLREYSFGDCLRTIFRVFIKHFRVLFLVCAVPALPVYWLDTYMIYTLDPPLLPGPWERLEWLVGWLHGLVILVTAAGTSVAVTHICVGKRAGVVRSYASLSDIRGTLVWTGVLLCILPIALLFVVSAPFSLYPDTELDTGGSGLVILVILFAAFLPLAIVLALAVVVVVLERRGGFGAIKRSYGLAKGHLWRNVGVLAIVFAAMAGWEAVALGGILAVELVMETDRWAVLEPWLVALGLDIATIMGTLLMNIAFVVLYYDCRVRAEGRDACRLALAQV